MSSASTARPCCTGPSAACPSRSETARRSPAPVGIDVVYDLRAEDHGGGRAGGAAGPSLSPRACRGLGRGSAPAARQYRRGRQSHLCRRRRGPDRLRRRPRQRPARRSDVFPHRGGDGRGWGLRSVGPGGRGGAGGAPVSSVFRSKSRPNRWTATRFHSEAGVKARRRPTPPRRSSPSPPPAFSPI